MWSNTVLFPKHIKKFLNKNYVNNFFYENEKNSLIQNCDHERQSAINIF